MTARGRFGLAVLLALARFPFPVSRLPAQDTTKGKVVYEKWCAGCHGDTGAGDGPAAAYMLPRPRNFTGAVYKIRTTASGQLPTDADLRSEEHTSELQSRLHLVCRLLLEKKKICVGWKARPAEIK